MEAKIANLRVFENRFDSMARPIKASTSTSVWQWRDVWHDSAGSRSDSASSYGRRLGTCCTSCSHCLVSHPLPPRHRAYLKIADILPCWLHRTVCLRLRYRLGAGVVVHVLTIQCCLALHFTWKCVRDWAALEIYLNGDWLRFSDHFSLKGDLEGLAKRIRRQAEDPTLFYVLGLVPLV